MVSILIPVKNASPFLEECLNSILNQTYKQWEVIAINDHSTDASKKILNSFAATDRRIRVYENPDNGIISALQTALSKSRGTYITRIDADDLIVPDRLEKMVNVLSKAGKQTIVTGLVKYFSDQPVSEGYLKYEKWINELNLSGNQWSQIYRECVIASPNWMINRDTLEEMGGFNDLTYPEDYHLVLKWYVHNLSIQTIPETTLLWREHPDRTSRNATNYSQEAFFRLKINHFIQHKLRNSELILWGKNEKTKLTSDILTKAGITFKQLELANFHETANFANPQILVGVYPYLQERKKIETYLSSLLLFEGKDWWYI